MTKSIETIWKEGFLKEQTLSAPIVNDLYNRKSQNLVDRLQHMFALNLKALIIGSIIMLAVMSLIGAPFLGLYICCLLTPLVFIANRELKKSVNLDKGLSSYEYLKNFDSWLKSSIKVYSNYYKWFYPLLFAGMATQAVVSKAGGKLIALLLEWLPTEILFLGLPFYLVLTLLILTAVMARYAEAIYQWDLNLVYGRQFTKLNELIDDMEELRT
jgi:hypothetical protein